ncbi:Uncharacterised protein [uncultured archaeon]|nr:Uncharacterised protein [uncultured archaeon]
MAWPVGISCIPLVKNLSIGNNPDDFFVKRVKCKWGKRRLILIIDNSRTKDRKQ